MRCVIVAQLYGLVRRLSKEIVCESLGFLGICGV